MAEKTVTVACCLPHGLVLEIGTPKVLQNGEISSTYKTAQVIGFLDAGRKAATFPTRKGLKFGITNVQADIWEAWLAKNKTLRYVVDKSVFVVT